jgi:hypothetical protein
MMDTPTKMAGKAILFAALSAISIGVGTNLWIGMGVFWAFTSLTYILEIYLNE